MIFTSVILLSLLFNCVFCNKFIHVILILGLFIVLGSPGLTYCQLIFIWYFPLNSLSLYLDRFYIPYSIPSFTFDVDFMVILSLLMLFGC